MKINKNLNYRKYDNTIIVLPEGDDCFILDGIAFEIFKLLLLDLDIDVIKNKLSENENNITSINDTIEEMIKLKIII